ncbi:MAG: AmmeMemoRadiSam system protein B [Thermoguttaceae bacterium]
MKYGYWRIGVVVLVVLCGCPKGQQRPAEPAGPPSVQQASNPSGQSTKPPGTIRQPAVAGLFYPDDPEQLAQAVDRYLKEARLPAESGQIKALRGLVVPHAGYEYSGPVAAVGYQLLAGRDIRTVIVMAPSHTADFRGAFVGSTAGYRTPLGVVPVSGLAARLVGQGPFVDRLRPGDRVFRPPWWRQSPQKAPPAGEDLPDTWEHSLEVQLPFLQRTLKDFTLVPIIFGEADPKAVAEQLAGLLDARTLLVASSDLSHYEPYQTARMLDASCIEAIVGLDTQRMQREDACGKLPILTLMHLARQQGWKARLLDYRNSGDTAGDKSRVVGYAAIAFWDEKAPQDNHAVPQAEYSPQERRVLLELARKTLVAVVHGHEPSDPEAARLPAKLQARRACFVTLTIAGRLRGCIGHLFPQEPLYKAVIDNTINAALRDTRFRPVGPDELDRIQIEISVLSVPAPLEFRTPEELLGRLRPHVDGVVLQVGSRQATYLPQVWEHFSDPAEFLSELSVKAGLPPTAWKSPQARVLVYQVEAFEETGHRKTESLKPKAETPEKVPSH